MVLRAQTQLSRHFQGTGTKLGDIEAIADNLKSVGSDDDLLKALHSVLFGGTGKKTTRKRDIRAFNGFAKNVSPPQSSGENATLQVFVVMTVLSRLIDLI